MNDVVKSRLFHPSPVSLDRVVFDIAGNKFRLICAIDFTRRVVYVKWFGTHAEYNRIDAASVENLP